MSFFAHIATYTDQIIDRSYGFDSRDLIDAKEDVEEILEEIKNADPDPSAPADEAEIEALIQAINKIEEETNATGEWIWGITFINEDRFERYAREFAEETGAYNGDRSWPVCCIDWKLAAKELAQDYDEIDIDGSTFLYRS